MKATILCGLAGLALLGAHTAQAGIFTLQDGNSVARFDTNQLAPNSRVGMDRWFVDGVNHMYSQWFWFRTDGMNSEARINSLPELVGGTTDTDFNGLQDTLFLRYGSLTDYTIDASFRLQGGSAGSRVSDVTEQLRIINHGTTARQFSFFQYCDFDLDSDVLDDYVEVVNPNAVRQSDFLSGTTVAETVITPPAFLSEVGIYAATLIKLDNAAVDNLDGTVGPLFGRRDYTWAFQWDFILQPGDTFLISKDKQITPTPGALALLGVGGLAALRRRR